MSVGSYNIFLSHIHEEQELAHALKDTIEAAFLDAVRVFVSSHQQDVRIGDDWFEEIEASLRESEAIILLLSPQSLTRPWVNFEAGAAWFLRKRVIPVCTRGLGIDDLPPPFSKRQAISLSSEEDRRRLISDIASVAGLRIPDYSFDEVKEANTAGKEQTRDLSNKSEEKEEVLPSYRSSELFEWRMGDAFPGLRDVEIIEDPELAADRLEIVLQEPLYRNNPVDEEGPYYPFWWFRGTGNNQIKEFQRLAPDRCLIGMKEFRIARLAAVRSFSTGERNFIYVESTGQKPVGCYKYDEGEVQLRLKQTQQGEFESDYCVREEYGLWEGHAITREEYDDGAAMINGEPTRTQGAELRVRYLTPYNMIVCPKRSVINNSDLDREMLKLMNNMLKDEAAVSDLVQYVGEAPRSPRMDGSLV